MIFVDWADLVELPVPEFWVGRSLIVVLRNTLQLSVYDTAREIPWLVIFKAESETFPIFLEGDEIISTSKEGFPFP